MSLRSDWLDSLADRPQAVQERMGDLWDEIEAGQFDPLPYVVIALSGYDAMRALSRKADEKGLYGWGRKWLAHVMSELVRETVKGGRPDGQP